MDKRVPEPQVPASCNIPRLAAPALGLPFGRGSLLSARCFLGTLKKIVLSWKPCDESQAHEYLLSLLPWKQKTYYVLIFLSYIKT